VETRERAQLVFHLLIVSIGLEVRPDERADPGSGVGSWQLINQVFEATLSHDTFIHLPNTSHHTSNLDKASYLLRSRFSLSHFLLSHREHLMSCS
jgi:hypothetical protein